MRLAMAGPKHVEVFTDGSCLRNPGPGGYGVVLRYREHEKLLSKGFRRTTNNRMEMMAAIEGLRALKQSCVVTLTTDSQYLRLGITQWIGGWKRSGWKTQAKEPVKNVDLWIELDGQVARHEVTWKWVKGHAGHRDNERCDALARRAAEGAAMEADAGYEAMSAR